MLRSPSLLSLLLLTSLLGCAGGAAPEAGSLAAPVTAASGAASGAAASAVTSGGLLGAGDALAAAPVRLDPRLADALSSGAGPFQVVVTFRGQGAPTPAQQGLLARLGILRGVTLRALPIAGVVASADQVRALLGEGEVRSLFLNRRLQYDNFEATALSGAQRVRGEAAFTRANGGLPVDGSGVGVLVNDSGVDGTLRDLEFPRHLVQNVAGNTNLAGVAGVGPITYLENVPNTDSTGGHGTHVAGIVAGTGAHSNGKYAGVAPGADLIGYGSGAALFLLDTLSGFDYALVHQAAYRIRVVTNSWGDTGDLDTGFDPADPINVATKACTDRNIVVVFSAGNSGPGTGTISGNYKKAPWVVTVANTTKSVVLNDSSSRGVAGRGGTAVVDGVSYTWEDRPTLAAPGTDIVSTRAIGSPVGMLSTQTDAETLEPEYVAFYTTLTGTSMAAPHVAGVVALMLDANPALTPAEVKELLQRTATNIPGSQPFEVGAGHVNAYAAVDAALTGRAYGGTLNLTRAFNTRVSVQERTTPFTLAYNPGTPATNRLTFTVPAGQAELAVRASVEGVEGQTGNTVNLVAIAPDGTETSSGVSVLFATSYDRTVVVPQPAPGTWAVELRGILTGNLALPETVQGRVTLKSVGAGSGLTDVAGHPLEQTLLLAVGERLVDGDTAKTFRPEEHLTRAELASYLVAALPVRQALPLSGVASFADVDAALRPFAEAVAAPGASMRDVFGAGRGVLLPTAPGVFSPKGAVSRADLAFALVQGLGLQAQAEAAAGGALTVAYQGRRIPLEDAAQVPAGVRGHVQLALDLNVLNAFFHVTQGPYDLEPTVHATFRPAEKVKRADYTVAATRYFSAYLR
jgi:serine protease AprX